MKEDLYRPYIRPAAAGMKRFDRFFYVKSGVINFDLPDGGGLSAGAGTSSISHATANISRTGT